MPGSPPRYAYLGPEGTFTEAALRSLGDLDGTRLQPHPTVASALDAVRGGESEAAMVPVENSLEGGVAVTLDELATGERLVVTREVLLPVTFALLGRPGTDRYAVRRVATHPVAAAQCRRWLARHLPDAGVEVASSTAEAAQRVAKGAGPDAAIAAPVAADRYGLSLLAADIGDSHGTVTRFLLVSRPGPPPPPSGWDKTSLAVSPRDDHPGALLQILTELAVRGVNLTRIESRPTGDGLGRYRFLLDCEGHVAEAAVGEALMGLHRVCGEVRFLGSYPRAGTAQPHGAGPAGHDFRGAAAWLAGVREGRP